MATRFERHLPDQGVLYHGPTSKDLNLGSNPSASRGQNETSAHVRRRADGHLRPPSRRMEFLLLHSGHGHAVDFSMAEVL